MASILVRMRSLSKPTLARQRAKSAAEQADLLMQDAPDDLYEAARARLLDPRKYPAEEIARRERLLEQTIADLNAPLHPNCYLSPTQFAEKFR